MLSTPRNTSVRATSKLGGKSVQVFCRLRPMLTPADKEYLRLKDQSTLMTSCMEKSQIEYKFKHVFPMHSTQAEVFAAVAKPLVEQLVRGHNSLLLTYGITGSGKTFTMTGDAQQAGIVPRCLQLLFSKIGSRRAPGSIFKPDRFNGFEVADMPDELKERHVFAVFVNYIEVYNNSVYDLLDEAGEKQATTCKLLRKDVKDNMYVFDITQLEVLEALEAEQAYFQGLKHKRMGPTMLNAESSRSHSVFNVRLVQRFSAYSLTVSQLSLVDLAGSERCSRTMTNGLRLREAGNINNSLMTLRTCLECLRENQRLGEGLASKKVPYRDAKITNLFKSFFEGKGQVSMIVCINPRSADFEENLQVLKFAERAQEVQIISATPMCATPVKREFAETEQLIYTLDQNFPQCNYEPNNEETEIQYQQLMEVLEHRVEKRKVLRADLEQKFVNFEMLLGKTNKENKLLCVDCAGSQKSIKQLSQQLIKQEQNFVKKEREITKLRAQCQALQEQLSDKEAKLSLITNIVQADENMFSATKFVTPLPSKKVVTVSGTEPPKIRRRSQSWDANLAKSRISGIKMPYLTKHAKEPSIKSSCKRLNLSESQKTQLVKTPYMKPRI